MSSDRRFERLSSETVFEGRIVSVQRDRYRSDSNQRWRSGCPHDELGRGEFEWLQLMTHPEIWVYEGATMRESMETMLAAEREHRWRQLEEDRIDLS